MAKINSNVLDALSKCDVNGNLVVITEKLDRNVYTSLNKVLETFGGKWNRKQKAHVFDSDPSDLIESAMITGEFTDIKKELQFFATPPEIVEQMLELADINGVCSVLEPSAGEGGIVDLISNPNRITCIEIYEPMAKLLKDRGYNTLCQDFLEYSMDTFDRIIMNPPFTRQQDIDHVLHAWSLLNEGGILVSVVSESCFFRSNKKAVDFRTFIDEHQLHVLDLDSGDFKVSGTMVKTRIIVLKKG